MYSMMPAAPFFDPDSATAPANWREVVRHLLNKIEQQQQTISEQQQQIETLLSQVKFLTRQIYGPKSDRFTAVAPGETPLPGFSAGELATAAEATTPPPPTNPITPPKPEGAANAGNTKATVRPKFLFPPDCPVIQRTFLPPEVMAQPEAYREIRAEQTELLHITPALFSKLIINRPVFVPIIKDLEDPSDSAPIVAELNTLQEDSHVSASTLAYIITSKYADHLPFYRQEQIYKTRHGIYLPRQTMCRWAFMAHEVWLPGILSAIKQAILRSNVLHIDETPIKYLCPGNGKTKQGYLWVIHAPGIGTYYHWSTSRGFEALATLLPEDWSGHIICDGYAVYYKLRKTRPERIKLCACMAHVRRKFFEARAQDPAYADAILLEIQQLYEIEARLRTNKASPAEILQIRQTESRPIYQRLQNRLEESHKEHIYLPKSELGQAIRYAVDQWADLLPVLDHPHLPIDNNPVERAIRGTAVGKKNYLFFGPGESGQVSAGYYTLIATAKEHGLDPFRYLEDLFEALPNLSTAQQAAWLPAAYAQAKPSQLQRYTETRYPANAAGAEDRAKKAPGAAATAAAA
jgi:hypothetical protein